MHNNRSIGKTIIIGVDESGRGATAGPMTIAAVVIEKYIVGIRDSKDMSPAGRERAAKSILRGAVAYEISVKDAKEIDNVGVDQATKDAMEEAIASVLHQLDRKELLDSSRIVTFVDGLLHPDTILTRLTTSSQFHLEVISLPKADKYVFQTSCAGIIAKETRDKIMRQLCVDYPQFSFDQHFGYATEKHRKELDKFGPSNIHRMTYLSRVHTPAK